MISSSKQYIWSEKDVLGSGATSTVYTGRSKSKGSKVAVKVFNNSSFMRPGEVQDREFEVLKQLRHRNVVQLLAIDVDERSRQRVIVMELCSKGSLYTMLDQPQSIFGVPEQEYKKILADICCGMKYLKQKEIVHRDLKPGNIMVLEDKDGQNVYKLADFGAARQLANDENFVSLYGTEEYLHPDMYARALLRETPQNAFTSKVDMWSLGVTLYHVATGRLPFRPYGGRSNKKTMHYLATKKASGVICGIQKDSVDGPITWERELPKSTQMSIMFKRMLTPLLAGLLESDPKKMMSAERFFEKVDSILNMEVFDVFDVQKAQMLKIYLHKDNTFEHLKESIQQLSDIAVPDQMILYQQQNYNPTTPCKQFPNTTEKEPMILLQKTLQAPWSVAPSYTPDFPSLPSNSHPDADYSYSKMSAGVMFYRQRALQSTLNAQHVFDSAVYSFRVVIRELLQRVERRMADVARFKVKVVTNLEGLKNHLNFLHTLEDILQVTKEEGQGNSMEISEIEALVIEIQEDYQTQTTILHVLDQELNEDKLNSFRLVESLCCDPGQRCTERFQVALNLVLESLEIFKANRRSKQRESVHIVNLEKLRLRDSCVEAWNHQSGHCETNLKNIHTKFNDWYNKMSILGKIEKIEEKVDWFKMKYDDLQKNIEKVMEDLEKKQDVLVSNFKNMTAKESMKSNSSGGSSASQLSLMSDFEVISSLVASIPEEEVDRPKGGLPFLQQTITGIGRKIQVKKDIKQQIIKGDPKEKEKDELDESTKLMEKFEQESASFYTRLSSTFSSNECPKQ
ncbi:serine/threonine-protein kinase TBK1-like [Anneissia japonica]|uniref:serine/threonine-protein kinase TBK1-like n=1 Tax=Anneissia japonica TaxID=1529436 RepID=UPI00142566E3|nr:serine/threonine-protein kinase TBK1-like [Anneissia japonica]XP_033123460.1 serine/threonine-protein kinase TBK1-like [Anneissia japonica]